MKEKNKKDKSILREFGQFPIKHKLLYFCSILVTVISCMIMVIDYEWGRSINIFKSPYKYIWIVIMFFLILLSIVSLCIEFEEKDYNQIYRNYLVHTLEKNAKEDNDVSQNVNIDVKQKVKNPSFQIVLPKAENKDIIALMLKNNDEITEYFKISKQQAKSSFWFSVIACIVGLIAILIGIYGIVILKDITISIISLISGSVSELISGTVFWVHNKSALQLNRYYDALHENEKFLSAVKITDSLSDEKREEVLIEIIRHQINSGTRIDVQEKE